MRELQIFSRDTLDSVNKGKVLWQVSIRHIPTSTYLGSNSQGLKEEAWITISFAKYKSKNQLNTMVDSWFDRQNKQRISLIEKYVYQRGVGDLYYLVEIDNLISNWYFQLHDACIEDNIIDPYLHKLINEEKLTVTYNNITVDDDDDALTHTKYASVPLSDVFAINKYEFECTFRKVECTISTIK